MMNLPRKKSIDKHKRSYNADDNKHRKEKSDNIDDIEFVLSDDEDKIKLDKDGKECNII